LIRSVEFDCVTLRERNQRFASRGGVMAAAARQKKARKKAHDVLAATFGAAPGLWYTPAGAAPSYTEPNPIVVRMWRVGPGTLDSDGPDDALKACRDGVADWLGLDDRNVGVEWPRGMQEKTAPRSPWRVRIEVEDRTPGADRRVVLASEPAKLKKAGRSPQKAKTAPRLQPDGDPGEELAARLLVPCPRCFVGVGSGCLHVGFFSTAARKHGVHVERAKAAGIHVKASDLDPMVDGMLAERPPRTGVRKMAARIAPPQQARLPLARVYALLPWRGHEAIHEPRVDGLSPPASMLYTVPDEHRATWGRTVTLYRQSRTAAGVGIITVYALKGR
jgi:hypothetical protein